MSTAPYKGRVVTANDLASGQVVYLTKENLWSANIDDAHVAANEAETAERLVSAKMAEAKNLVTGSYAFEASKEPGSIVPDHIRERIRTSGPTIDPIATGHAPASITHRT